jgi:hypothetical protein
MDDTDEADAVVETLDVVLWALGLIRNFEGDLIRFELDLDASRLGPA